MLINLSMMCVSCSACSLLFFYSALHAMMLLFLLRWISRRNEYMRILHFQNFAIAFRFCCHLFLLVCDVFLSSYDSSCRRRFPGFLFFSLSSAWAYLLSSSFSPDRGAKIQHASSSPSASFPFRRHASLVVFLLISFSLSASRSSWYSTHIYFLCCIRSILWW